MGEQPKRRQVVGPKFVGTEGQDALEVGGHHERRGDPVMLDGGQRGRGVESLLDDDRASRLERAQCVAMGAGVRQRRADEMDVRLGHAP